MGRYRLGPVWWKKITSVHHVFIQIATRLFEEGAFSLSFLIFPESETLGRTVLISKREKHYKRLNISGQLHIFAE